jgi:2-polyprenyl-6-methoxyphenol hydroxylase-like FAD-dependent oxidoreductase
MRAVIIGAGLGGLCLAHGLIKAGIEVAVYERSPEAGAQPASYGIHLNADGLRALHTAMPEKNWEQFTRTTVPARNVVRFHDPNHGVLATLDFETPEHANDPITRRRAVNRGNLRDALLVGLDGPDGIIQWAKRFSVYEELPDGRFEIHFEDGTTTTADILIGADGGNSRVRKQRLPGLDRVDLGILNVAGRVPVTPEIAAFLPAELADSAVNNVVPARPGWLFVSTWSTGDTASAAIAGSEGTDRYVVWAWCGRKETYPKNGEGLTSEQLKAHVSAQLAGWSRPLQRLIEATDAADIGPIPLRTMPHLEDWYPSYVTLLGDAIHSMTPMGGVGANTALRDSENLRDALVTHQNSPLDGIALYERRMREYANEALKVSTANAVRAVDPSQPQRTIFRTLLRVAEAVPPIKRRIFHVPAHTVNG